MAGSYEASYPYEIPAFAGMTVLGCGDDDVEGAGVTVLGCGMTVSQ